MPGAALRRTRPSLSRACESSYALNKSTTASIFAFFMSPAEPVAAALAAVFLEAMVSRILRKGGEVLTAW